jgi:hypothetical protein
MRPRIVFPFLLLTLCALVVAQPVVLPPNFTVTPVASAVTMDAAFMSMAADAEGNVYLVEGHRMLPGSGYRVHRVRADGVIEYDHAAGLGAAGQIAYDPADGLVYLVTVEPNAQESTVWRIEPAGGATFIQTVGMKAEGFTIDNHGKWYFGGKGTQGEGLYLQDVNALLFLGTIPPGTSGFEEHWVLQSLVSDDVLIARTEHVMRFSVSQRTIVPFFTIPLPQPMPMPAPGMPMVMGMARTPHNQLGAGALLGFHEFSGGMGSMSGTRKAVSTDLLGSSVAGFAAESFGSGGMMQGMGMVLLASGVRNDTWWLTVTSTGGPSNPIMSGSLYRIEQSVAAGVPGSLFVTAAPGQIAVDLDGPAGAPFLLGIGVLPVDGMFAPGFGWIDLSLIAPNYLAIFDGPGAFGIGNPTAVIPPSGRFSWSLNYPALPVTIPIASQALILAMGTAPNGGFYVSNVVETALE